MSRHVLNRREEHKRLTRAALEEAALALFARNGYEQTTVEEIAEAAGVSVRTFFRYFSGKRHVLFGDVAYDRISRLGRLLEARPVAEDPLESVRAVFDEIEITDERELEQIRVRMRLMLEQPSLVPTYLSINHELSRQVAQFVAHRLGVPPTHPYPLTVAAAASTAWDVALHAWSTGQAGDLAQQRRSIFDQLTQGLIPARPRAGLPRQA
jgi:TetR/AcrR family transcriptional regulator, regulator of mycofactocin system